MGRRRNAKKEASTMMRTQHPSNTRALGAPKDWDHGHVECGALPITDVTLAGHRAMKSYWRPTTDELEILNGGGLVTLHIIMDVHPPVSVGAESAPHASALGAK